MWKGRIQAGATTGCHVVKCRGRNIVMHELDKGLGNGKWVSGAQQS